MASTAVGSTPVQLGAAIRAAREARGMSLRELARRIDVSPSFVSQIGRASCRERVSTIV